MPKYLWKGKAPSGEIVVERVEAPTLQESKQFLLQSGYTELEAQSDEFYAAAAEMFDFDCSDVELTPKEELELQNRGRSTVGGVVWESLLGSKKWGLFWGALLGLGVYLGKWWLTAIAAALFVAKPMLQSALLLPSIYYSRLNRAKVWGRWNEVQSTINTLKKFAWIPWNVPASELARNEALVLAANGNLAQALAAFAPYANKLDQWLYISQCVAIYDEAKDFDTALRLSEKVNELVPASDTQLLDHAIRLVRRHNRPDDAEGFFSKVDTSLLPPFAKPYIAFYHGLIAFRRAYYSEARERFDEAIEGISAIANLDLIEGIYLVSKAYLCATERALGNEEVADELWGEVKEFLQAHKEQELIEACSAQVVVC